MEKIKEKIKSLKEEIENYSDTEKERIKSFILDTFDFKAYDLLYAAKKKTNRVDVGNVILLKDLVDIGFNYIKIYSEEDELICGGYEEYDFVNDKNQEKDILNKKVEITGFYNDLDDYLCVETKIFADDPFPNFTYDESKNFSAISDGDVVIGILDKDSCGNYYIIERTEDALSFVVTDTSSIKEIDC